MALTVTQEHRIKMLETALGVALKFHEPDIPGDSRAVPDWFVVCATVLVGIGDEDGKIEQCLNENMMLEIQQHVADAICEIIMD